MVMGTPDGGPRAYRAVPRTALGGWIAWVVLTVGQFAAVIAMLQRSSLGVATTDAIARFGITAATLAAFSMVQLLVYAVLQVPVGVLIDQYGSKRLIVVGSLIMAGAQTMFAVAATLPLAFAARVALGVGDALTFISVMRLVPGMVPARAQREADDRDRAGQPAGLRRCPRSGFAARPRRGRVDPVIPGLPPRSASAPRHWRWSCCATRRRAAPRASRSVRRSPRRATASARHGPSQAPGSGSGLGFMTCSRA